MVTMVIHIIITSIVIKHLCITYNYVDILHFKS